MIKEIAKFRQKATIKDIVGTFDAIGQPTVAVTTIASNVPCYINNRLGTTGITAGIDLPVAPATIMLRDECSKFITPTCTLEIQGKKYNVISFIDPNGMHETIELTVKEILT